MVCWDHSCGWTSASTHRSICSLGRSRLHWLLDLDVTHWEPFDTALEAEVVLQGHETVLVRLTELGSVS